jgi:hypothetical protein
MSESEIEFETLEQLQRERRDYVKSAQRNNFQKGITKLLTELYPDQAHFIDELLQNAEDSRIKSDNSSKGATHVFFTLTKDALEFKHNGEGLFTLENIVGVTGLASSTSKNDPTSIGKFGVGFKAVFAYTNSPRIHSGEYDFSIQDLFIPNTESISRPEMPVDETRFIFPFNNPRKPSEVALAEIKKGLLGLADNTLLFLRHIRQIDYMLPDGIFGSIARIDQDHCRIQIEANQPNVEKSVSHWLRFQKEVVIEDEEADCQGKSDKKRCGIAIAYNLVEIEANNWVISPLEDSRIPAGEVSIYFPVRSEKPGLRFHLHAPFASTVARAEIREKDTLKANGMLRDSLAELVVESLMEIRKLGMLTMDFLKVLPNSNDPLENFYKPIHDEIVSAFNTQPLLPTICGKYAPADCLYRADKSITGTKDQPGLISEDELKLLTNNDKAMWLANAPSSGRINEFIEDTEVKKWDLYNIFKYSDKEKLETWLVGKSDQWVLLFYELLNGNQITELRNLNIKLVRVHKASGDIHLPANKVYLAPKDDAAPLPNDIDFVKKSTYQKQGNEEGNSKAEQTLRSLGVEPYNEETVIKLILEKNYSSPSSIPLENHIQDIGKFIAFWLRNRNKSEIFKYFYFLRSNVDDEIKFQKPENLCLDSPYIETGLSEFIDIHRKEAIWHGYLEKLDRVNCKSGDFLSFLQEVGVFHKLEVVLLDERTARNNSIVPHDWNYDNNWNRKTWDSPNRIAKDYSITDLKQYLVKNNALASRLIWDALISAPNDAVRAKFAVNRNHQKSGESQLVQKLKDAYWIPDKSGYFKKPCEITKDDLRDDFKYEIKANLSEDIGFGEHAKDMRKKQAAQEYLEEQGINTDELDEIVKLKKEFCVDLDDFRKYVAKQKRKEFPKAPVDTANPEILKKKIIQNSEDQPEKESVKIERSIQKDLPKEKAEAKAYLRGKYRNSDHELICQCCKDEMPFKIDEYHYFEAVQFIKNITKVYKQNYLALCPTCAAKYKYARETADDDIRRSLVENDSPNDSPSVVIPVRLAGEDASIEFVGKHWFELKTILRHLNPDTDLESLILD